MQSPEKHSKVAQRFSQWTALSSLALIAVTWRLWTPQTSFPQVPLFHALCNAPLWLDWVGLVGALVGLLAIAICTRPRLVQVGCAITLASLLLLFSLDQHRFQPWAYELWLFCVIWLGCRARSSMQLMRVLLISVYFYSAVGKLDFEFLHTVGQQMLAVVVGAVGVDPQDLSPSTRLAMVAAFPCIELAAAIGLVWTRTRQFAGWLAIGVHLALVVILGPLGLNHRLGVLVWNVQVALQAYWLFVAGQASAKPTEAPKPSVDEPSVDEPSVDGPSNDGQPSKHTWSEWLVTATMGAAVALPSTERLGLWDHWPSWALYAPHSSRVYLEIAAPAVERLPADLRSLVQEPPTDSEEVVLWLVIPMDVWSLETLDTPIYPQARFQLGVAERIALDMNAGFQARFTVLGISSRFTGARRTTVYAGLQQLTDARQPFWVNHHPRSHLKAP